MNKSVSEYLCMLDSLSRSRDLTKELGNSEIQFAKSVIDELTLAVNGTKISIWSIYEVILAIHFFPKRKPNRIRNSLRLLKGKLTNQTNSFRSVFFPQVRSEIEGEYGNNIVFLGFNNYLAFENFELIIKNIIDDEIYSPICIDDKPNKNFKLLQNHVDINQIVSNKIKADTINIKRDIKKLIQKMIFSIKSSELNYEKSTTLLGAIDFMRPEMETRIPKYLSAAINILNNVRPSAIVSIDVADPRNRVFTLLANKIGIPVIQLQAGNINQETIEWSFCDDDLMLSHGPNVKPQLAKLGFNIEKVVETGSAKLEKVINTRHCEEISLHSRFMINKNTTVLLFLTSYIDLFDTQDEMDSQKTLYNEIYLAVITEVSKKKNISLVIKPHPLEVSTQLAQHNKMASKHENIFVAKASDNTSELIVASDALISFGSTATLDALVLGKPVICPKFKQFMLNEIFSTSSAVSMPTNVVELSEIMDVIDSGDMSPILHTCAEGRIAFLRRLSNLDGSASKVIISNIYAAARDFNC